MKTLYEKDWKDDYETYEAKYLCDNINELKMYIAENIWNISYIDMIEYADTDYIIEYINSIPLIDIKIYRKDK